METKEEYEKEFKRLEDRLSVALRNLSLLHKARTKNRSSSKTTEKESQNQILETITEFNSDIKRLINTLLIEKMAIKEEYEKRFKELEARIIRLEEGEVIDMARRRENRKNIKSLR